MCDEQLPAIVFDSGSGTCKVGFAGDAFPRLVFPSVVGRICQDPQDAAEWLRHKDTFVGQKALINDDHVLTITYPIERAVVINWDDMIKIWDHAFYENLRTKPEGHPILVTEPPLTSNRNREKKTEIMFENYGSPSLYIALQAVLCLYASGRTTGLVLDCGDGVSDAVPIFAGYALPHATFRLEVAGGDLTDYLMKMLNEEGHSFTSTRDKEVVRDIKEKLAYVPNRDKNIHTNVRPEVVEETYELPDGQEISIGTERFRCTEALFLPSVLGVGSSGISETAYNAITKCDVDTRKELFSNIVVCGGTTNLKGFSDRVHWELLGLAPGERISIFSPTRRKYMAWLGGSILGSLSSFSKMWISKKQYEEEGLGIVYKKCF